MSDDNQKDASLSPLSRGESSFLSSKSKLFIVEGFKWFLILLLVIIIIIALIYNDEALSIIKSYLEWMSDNIVLGTLCYCLLYVIWVIIALPGSSLCAGLAFVYASIDSVPFWIGLIISGLLSWIFWALGNTLAFLNGRYLMRSTVIWCLNQTQRKKRRRKHKNRDQNNNNNKNGNQNTNASNGGSSGDGKKKHENKEKRELTRAELVQILEKIVENYGIKIIILLRINFIVPYSVINYGMSVSNMEFKYFMFAHIGMMADIIIYTFIGATISTISDISRSGVTSNLPILIISISFLVLSFAGVFYIICISTRKIKLLIEQERENMDNMDNMNDDNNGNDNDNRNENKNDKSNMDVELNVIHSDTPESPQSAQLAKQMSQSSSNVGLIGHPSQPNLVKTESKP